MRTGRCSTNEEQDAWSTTQATARCRICTRQQHSNTGVGHGGGLCAYVDGLENVREEGAAEQRLHVGDEKLVGRDGLHVPRNWKSGYASSHNARQARLGVLIWGSRGS